MLLRQIIRENKYSYNTYIFIENYPCITMFDNIIQTHVVQRYKTHQLLRKSLYITSENIICGICALCHNPSRTDHIRLCHLKYFFSLCGYVSNFTYS